MELSSGIEPAAPEYKAVYVNTPRRRRRLINFVAL